jgi:hypothetical protein
MNWGGMSPVVAGVIFRAKTGRKPGESEKGFVKDFLLAICILRWEIVLMT